MNIDIFYPLSIFCTIAIPLTLIHFGMWLARRITNKALEKEDLEAIIYCRDMYRDIYKDLLDQMSNISHWLVTYDHSPSMTSKALNKIYALEDAAKKYKTLWENNEKLIPINMR